MKKLKVLSLFDGMSCGRLALKDLGYKDDEIEYYASEIKKHGIKVSSENFPDTIHIGDVTKVRYDNGTLYTENGNFDVGYFDIVMGGSPCQDFSIAKARHQRLGLKGEKSRLFYEYLRILKEVKPKFFLLENVASMDKESLKQLNEYMGVEAIKINSNFILPAHRNRLYWTNLKVEPFEKTRTKTLVDFLTDGYTNKELSCCLMEGHSRPNADALRMTRRHLEIGIVPLVYKSKEHYEQIIEHYNKHYKGLSAIEVNAIRDDIDNSVYDGVRTYNHTEMERLQGVPEGYTKMVTRNESASLLGDGWTVPVITHILKDLKNYI